jgi:phytanoyl-CoA hydroxylase
MQKIQLKLNKKFNFSQKNFNSYKEKGYFLIKNLFSTESCKKLKNYAEKYYAEKPNYPITLNIHRKDNNFFKVITNKSLTKIVKFFQDSKIDALNDQMIYKKKNSTYGGQSWTFHQDNSYPRAKYGAYVIVHLFLDDSTPNNGGLIFFEGSHKEKLLKNTLRVSHKERKNKRGLTRPGRTINSYDLKRVQGKYNRLNLDAKKGSVCIMHSNLVHGSFPNLSKIKDRATYSMAYLNRGSRLKFSGIVSKKIRTKIN